jgi:hypothetical protein
VDHQRALGVMEHVEEPAGAAVAILVEESGRGQLQPDEAPLELARQRGSVGFGEPCRSPPPEWRRQREHAVVIGVKQLIGLSGRQKLDSERARE